MQMLPQWLSELPITNLDVSFCRVCNVSAVSEMTSLTVLSLQVCATHVLRSALPHYYQQNDEL